MLTIGLTHLYDLIVFLKAGEVSVVGLQPVSRAFPSRNTELALLKKQVSVTVIIPRSLMSLQI